MAGMRDDVYKILSLMNKRRSYRLLSHDEGLDGAKVSPDTDPGKPNRRYQVVILFLSLVGLFIAFALLLLAWPAVKHRSLTCHTPLQRREWRTLQPSEHQEYIDAVLCLSSRASIFEPVSSRYDDFTYAHVFEGANTAHYAAAFLPWHRYFIHLLEAALRDEYGFSGLLPYWDWALDSENIAASPVWDPVEGFGGDGDFSFSGPELFEGRCVVDGPFTNVTRHWEAKSKETGHGYDLFASQHCLSRGFDTSSEKQEVFRSHISPAAIDALLNQPTYAEFIDKLEVKAHNTIPLFVRGDFLGLSAPNDPVWYLHHAQVDRLWWLWQQRDPANRMYQYHGPGENTRIYENVTHSKSSVEDFLSFGQFADSVQVKNVMSTQSNLLCYSY